MKKILFISAAVLLLAAGCSSQTATNVDTTPSEQPATNPGATNGNSANLETTNAAASESSNASLNSSLSNVDGQMDSLNSDSASIDSSMNEQQAP